MVMTGKALVSILLIDDGSASAGSLLRTELTVRSTSTGARSLFAAVVNWMKIEDTPSLEIELMVSIFGSAATASSIGLVIWVSIVAGSAPASVVVMTTKGKLMLGTTPTPICVYDTSPKMSSATVRAATIKGLRRENSVIFTALSSGASTQRAARGRSGTRSQQQHSRLAPLLDRGGLASGLRIHQVAIGEVGKAARRDQLPLTQPACDLYRAI